jgi:DNA-directed RNA polymerase subunit E'/Rpb7
MEKLNQFNKYIEIPPIYLDSNIKHNIIKIIQSQKICSREEGYISKICDIISIESIGISRNTNYPIFRVIFTAMTILPEVGKLYQCKIVQIYAYAVLVEYHKGSVKIIVPAAYFGKYKYQESKLHYKNTTVEVGNNITVILEDVKYSKGVFNCIARIP